MRVIGSIPIPKSLTDGERRVLKRLADGEELEEFVPGGWWVDCDKIAGRIGWSLLRKMAIHDEGFVQTGHRIYTINQTGRELLEGKPVTGFVV